MQWEAARIRALSLVLAVLSGCAGVSKVSLADRVDGLCLRMASERDYLVQMNLCNCGVHREAFQIDSVPWLPTNRSNLSLTLRKGKEREAATAREFLGFNHPEPWTYYRVPPGECLTGSIDLREAFYLDGIPADNLAEIDWSGYVYGANERWLLNSNQNLEVSN
jgi:hypothetical protein